MKKNDGRRVFCLGQNATVVKEGPEQSEVRFDNGFVQIVVNEWIKEIEIAENKKGN